MNLPTTLLRTALLIVIATSLLSGCGQQVVSSSSSAPGFFLGLFHGFFAFFAFIAGLFSDVRMYSSPNSGSWYDFGFLIGIVLFFEVVSSTEESS